MTIGVQQLETTSVPHLLRLHGAVIDELRRRKILRSKNTPVGDYAEWLTCTMLGLTMLPKSSKCVDAIDGNQKRYQIKSRRVTPDNRSVQLGAIRNLKEAQFDYLLGVLFDQEFSVMRAVRIPYDVVGRVATYRAHTNAHIMHLRPSLFEFDGVVDVTEQLRT